MHIYHELIKNLKSFQLVLLFRISLIELKKDALKISAPSI